MRNEKNIEKRTTEGIQRARGKPFGPRRNIYNQSEGFAMYRKVMLSLTLLCLILLTLIAWEVGVFTAIAGLPFFPLVEKIVVNTINEQIQNIAQFFVYFKTFEMRKIKKYIDFHLGTNRIFCAFFQICSFIGKCLFFWCGLQYHFRCYYL